MIGHGIESDIAVFWIHNIHAHIHISNWNNNFIAYILFLFPISLGS